MRERSKMNRKIIIEFSDSKIKISATLLDEEEPEQCDMFWETLKTPLKMICQHTLSTGDYFATYGRPPKRPVKTGSQANPIGRKQWLLCQLEPGMLLYTGGNDMAVAYGPHITEPLVGRGSVAAKVDKEDLDNLMKAGKGVWNAQYMTHRLVIMTVRTREK